MSSLKIYSGGVTDPGDSRTHFSAQAERGVGVAQIAWRADVEDHTVRRERDLGLRAQESLVVPRVGECDHVRHRRNA